MTRARTGLLVATLVSLSGCYGLHALSGQLSILCNREDIEDVLADPHTTPLERRRLELVQATRRYAIDAIGLAENGSYTCVYDTQGGPVAWNVSASSPDALAPYLWTFPFVGTIPYVGFFAREPAAELARDLRAEGLDVLVLPVPAYSTLGWFDDPVFSSMLFRDESSLVETVIHELAHATVWIDGDAVFNENLASFVGEQGARDFFRKRGGAADPGLKQSLDNERDATVFRAAMADLREQLARIYAASGTRAHKRALKAEAFERFRAHYRRVVRPQLSDDGYDWILSKRFPFNNAFVMQYQRYHGDAHLFRAVHEKAGGDLRATVERLKALADADDPRAALTKMAGADEK